MSVHEFEDAAPEGATGARFVETAEVERGVVLSGVGATREEALADLHAALADEFNA